MLLSSLGLGGAEFVGYVLFQDCWGASDLAASVDEDGRGVCYVKADSFLAGPLDLIAELLDRPCTS